MPTRREILKRAGQTATVLTATAPWWLVRRAHAAQGMFGPGDAVRVARPSRHAHLACSGDLVHVELA